MTLQDKRSTFLQDTIAYYSVDPVNRRCNNPEGGCYYSPLKAGKKGISEGCAIGRHLSPALQEELDEKGFVGNDSVFNRLPEELKELGQDFLLSCQRLHDYDDCWDKEGLTEDGQQRVEYIVKDFDLSINITH